MLAFILVICLAISTVHFTKAALNNIGSPTSMVALPSETGDNNLIDSEQILTKNGTTWQLKKLKLR